MSNPILLSMRLDLKKWNVNLFECKQPILFFCVNTRPGRIIVYVCDVKDFIFHKISFSSFLLKSVLTVCFLLATYLGWTIGDVFFPKMYCVPSFLCSMLCGNISDRLIRFLSKF